MPPLIATATLDHDTVDRLRNAFAAVGEAPELAQVRATLLLKRFAHPAPADYDVFRGILESAERYAEVW